MCFLLFSFPPKREAVSRVFSPVCTKHCQIVSVVVQVLVCHLTPWWAFFNMQIHILFPDIWRGGVVLNILLHRFSSSGLHLYDCHSFFVSFYILPSFLLILLLSLPHFHFLGHSTTFMQHIFV